MLQRNLLYTGITRGKRLVVLVGSKRALAIAVKNNSTEERCTMLTAKINVSDRTIKRELGVLRMGLAMAKSRGLWTGDLDALVPEDFTPLPTPKGDTISRASRRRRCTIGSSCAGNPWPMRSRRERRGSGSASQRPIPNPATVKQVCRFRWKQTHRMDRSSLQSPKRPSRFPQKTISRWRAREDSNL